MQFETEQERLIRMIQYAEELGLLPSGTAEHVLAGERTENQYVLDFSTESHAVQPIMSDLQELYENMDINLASGEALDRWGRLLHVTRYPAQAPRVVVSVELALENDADVVIPAGTTVTVDGQDSSIFGDYVTLEETVINAGTVNASFVAVGSELGFRPALPIGSVTGVDGFSFISCTNTAMGTEGCNIEEDDDYRLRLNSSARVNTIGLRECFEDYLYHFDGLDSFYLVPLYDGVGSLKIVCDTVEELLPSIADGVTQNCKLETDKPVLCVLPESVALEAISLSVTRNPLIIGLTDDELGQLLIAQVHAFVEGGFTRDGLVRKGLGVGGDLYPSELLAYLMENFSECLNIRLKYNNADFVEPVEISVTEKATLSTVEVEFV